MAKPENTPSPKTDEPSEKSLSEESLSTDYITPEERQALDEGELWPLFVQPPGIDEFKIKLIRRSPQTIIDETGEQVKISGRLEDIDLSIEDIEEYVARKYGGGTYQAQQLVRKGNRRWGWSKGAFFDIPGRPKWNSAQEPTPTPGISPPSGATLDINGVPVSLDGDMEDIQRQALKIKMLNTMFPQPVDPNIALIEMLRERREPQFDFAKIVETGASMIAAVKDILPTGGAAGGGETNLMDVFKEGLVSFQKFVEAQADAPARSVKALPAPRTQTNPTNPNSETSDNIQEAQPMNAREKANYAIQQIISAYTLETPMSVQDISDVIDSVLNLSDFDKNVVRSYRKVLRNQALVAANSGIDPDLFDEAHFCEYVDQVFDLLIGAQSIGAQSEAATKGGK